MIHRVRVRCKDGYDGGIATDLQKMGMDRIKLHPYGVSAEYKVPYNICTNGCGLLEAEVKGLEHGSSVEGVDVWKAARWNFVMPFYEIYWKLSPAHRKKMAGYESLLKSYRDRAAKKRPGPESSI